VSIAGQQGGEASDYARNQLRRLAPRFGFAWHASKTVVRRGLEKVDTNMNGLNYRNAEVSNGLLSHQFSVSAGFNPACHQTNKSPRSTQRQGLSTGQRVRLYSPPIPPCVASGTFPLFLRSYGCLTFCRRACRFCARFYFASANHRRFEHATSLRRLPLLKTELLIELIVRLTVDLDIRVDEVVKRWTVLPGRKCDVAAGG